MEAAVNPPAEGILLLQRLLGPVTSPVLAVAGPVLSVTSPVHPVANPVQQVTNPVHPVTNPVHPMTSPVHPVTNPVHPVTSSVQPVTSPVPPVTNVVQPTHSPTFSTVPGNNSSSSQSPTNAKMSTEDRPWICQQCGFPFKYKNNLAEHMRFYHMKGSVPCNKCSQVFPTSTHLRHHRKDHAAEQGRCPHCRCTFPGTNNNPELYKELYQKHLPECRRCPAKKSKIHVHKDTSPNKEMTSFNEISSQIDPQKSFVSEEENDTYVLCCLMCCRKFKDLVDYETHRCSRTHASVDRNNIIMVDKELSNDENGLQQAYPQMTAPPFENTSTPSATSDIDFNYLCIICGVNFENEEKLNLHLYENHQSCDQDNENQNVDDVVTVPNDSQPTFSCATCSENFNECSDLEKHRDQCGTQVEISDTTLTEDLEKTADSDENVESDVMVCWVCKYCKMVFPSKSEMHIHKGKCVKKQAATCSKTNSSAELCVQEFNLKDLTSTDKDFKSSPQCSAVVNSIAFVGQDSEVVEKVSDSGETGTDVKMNVINSGTHDSTPIKNASSPITSDFDVIHETSAELASSDTNLRTSISLTQEPNVAPCVSDFALPVSQDSPNIFCSATYAKDNKNTTDRKKHSQDESETQDSDLIVQWLCKYCKKPFPTKDEMRIHKEVCALEHRTSFQCKGVLVRWVCKYCKQDFESRECMRTHKHICSSRNKDRSIISSTESDMSEVVLKESALNGNVNSLSRTEDRCKEIDLNVDDKHNLEKPEESVQNVYCHSEDNINGAASAQQNDSKDVLSPVYAVDVSDSEHKKLEVFVHHYNLNKIQQTTSKNSETRVCDNNNNINNNNNEINNCNINNINNNNNSSDNENQCNLFNVPDEQGDTLVKWVCKYCKNVFDAREEMSVHKKTCALRSQRKTLFSSAESDKSEFVLGASSPLKSKFVKNEIVKSPLPTVENSCEPQHKAQPNIKLKIKLCHACNICGRKFPVRKLLRAHRLESHMQKCSRCGRYFSSTSMLWKHARLCRAQKLSPENRKRQVYACKKCYRVFRERYRYKLHKGSCEHQKIDRQQQRTITTISLPHEKVLLRIHCHKCSGFYTSGEIIRLHTCEKSLDIEAFLCCQTCLQSFTTIPEFCKHSLDCDIDLLDISAESIPSRIVCHTCLRQFDSIYFFYQHLITGTCREDFFKNYVDYSLEFLNNSVQPDEESSSSAHSIESSDEDDIDWTCNFCSFIYPSSIPKHIHYQMCQKRKLISDDRLGKLKNLPKTSPKERLELSLPTVKVVLHRLPDNLIPQDSNSSTPEPDIDLMELNLKQTPIQRCVICYKRCRFAGTGLPPIGQLECFRCREKAHKKELKRRGEQFYCRSVFDEELGPKPVMQIEGQNVFGDGYLDPSKRLKISRALYKSKNSSQDKVSGEPVCEITVTPKPVTVEVLPSTSSCTKRLVQKCSHCKRGFTSKGQLEKHVKLSKTCLQAEMARLKLTRARYASAESKSSIINFVDFLSTVPCSLSMDESGVVTLSSQTVSPTDSGTQNFSNSCSSMEIDDHSIMENELSNSSYSQISMDSVENSRLSEQQASQPNSRPSFLVLQNVEKVLTSCSITKRVPNSPALQCDGWILKSSGGNGSKKIKLICGACYKSFPNNSAFTDHVSSVHQLSLSCIAKLNVMKHIPEELLNKITW